MADYMAGDISIGGTIPASMLPELYEAILKQGASIEPYNGELDSLDEFVDAVRESGDLRLVDHDAAGGYLPILEQFCQRNGLHFVATADAKYEHDGEVRWWSPGMSEPRSTVGTQEGTPMVACSSVAELLEAGSAEEKVQAIRELLERVMPPKLPPLVIKDE